MGTEGGAVVGGAGKAACRNDGPDGPVELAVQIALREGRKLYPHPPKLKLEELSQDPALGICQAFLRADECARIIELAEAKGFIQSHTGSTTQGDLYTAMGSGNPYEGLDITVSETRTAMVCILEPEDDPIVAVTMERVAYLAECHVEQVECLSVVRYFPGQFFKEHHDGSFRPKTVFLYLNTVEPGDGGETKFPYIGYKIRPQAGLAAMWENTLEGGIKADARTIHEGLPTHKATKYGINCFINENKVQRRLVNVPKGWKRTIFAEEQAKIDAAEKDRADAEGGGGKRLTDTESEGVTTGAPAAVEVQVEALAERVKQHMSVGVDE